ncbi:PAS domain-containing protein [Dongia sp.]|uniref:PAS domain-containing protein n=1 Tax=Dongia sp. TaxID=1977262 RepID=UPI0035B40010
MPTTLTDIRDAAGLRADPRFGRLIAHVEAKRQGRRWAARGDIDASDIPALLPNIWIIEIEPASGDLMQPRLRVRLAGTQVERIYGRTLSGIYLESLDWGAHSDRIFASLNRMADEGIGHFLDVSAQIQPRLSRRVRRLGLPLSDDQQRVSHLMLLAYYEFNATAPEHFHEFWLP